METVQICFIRSPILFTKPKCSCKAGDLATTLEPGITVQECKLTVFLQAYINTQTSIKKATK